VQNAINALGNAESDSADGSQVADLLPSAGNTGSSGSLANPKTSAGRSQMQGYVVLSYLIVCVFN
jgi:hypothetical protein